MFLLFLACAPAPVPAPADPCATLVGAPRVSEPAPGVFVAQGYDLANTILVRTAAGNVVIDVGMSPARARAVRTALDAVAPGTVAAVIYTHSHIDHVGGASVWVEEGTEIWATEAFTPRFLDQYGAMREAEAARGSRQFGRHLGADATCSSIGLPVDFEGVANPGIRLPTRTFSGAETLDIGGVRLDLFETPGETTDHLAVWLPATRTLLAGDDYYAAFPNLYTIRGTRPRPVDSWIRSLDAMRRLAPEVLIPSHTSPIVGMETVRRALTDYRDGIQWVRDEVVRRANAGESLDQVAAIQLPAHLLVPGLAQLYGQVDWSARGIYTNELGWFDGDPADLYPATDTARREVEAMGGREVVLEKALAAIGTDPRWAVHLLAKLRDAGAWGVEERDAWRRALRTVAAGVPNTNGRAYLLESAWEDEHGPDPMPPAHLDDAFLDAIPVAHFFRLMPYRLDAAATLEVEESIAFEMTDTGERFVMTVRRGIAEVAEGEALPGTPAPTCTLRTTTGTWKRLALRHTTPLEALLAGSLQLDGSEVRLARFLSWFR